MAAISAVTRRPRPSICGKFRAASPRSEKIEFTGRARYGRSLQRGLCSALRTKLPLAVFKRTTGSLLGELLNSGVGFKVEKHWLRARVNVFNR